MGAARGAEGDDCEVQSGIRDTIIDRPATWRQRIKDGAGRFLDALSSAFLGGGARLSEKLPPVTDNEQGELLLLSLLRASPAYQNAVIAVANRALDAREAGDNAYADFAVHFTLSRMKAGRDGRIAIGHLRDLLRYLPFAGTLAPALIRLEEQGVVRLVLDSSDGDPMTEILRARITHVELRVPV